MYVVSPVFLSVIICCGGIALFRCLCIYLFMYMFISLCFDFCIYLVVCVCISFFIYVVMSFVSYLFIPLFIYVLLCFGCYLCVCVRSIARLRLHTFGRQPPENLRSSDGENASPCSGAQHRFRILGLFDQRPAPQNLLSDNLKGEIGRIPFFMYLCMCCVLHCPLFVSLSLSLSLSFVLSLSHSLSLFLSMRCICFVRSFFISFFLY